MFRVFLVWLLSTLVVYGTSAILPGFKIKSFGYAFVVAAIIGLLNMIIRPFLIFLTFPINILTLGLFTFVVNAIILKMAAWMLKGFDISSWGTAILGALIIALFNALVNFFFGIQ